MKAWFAVSTLLVSLVLAAPQSRADALPIDAWDCQGKKAGDGCSTTNTGKTDGTCKEDLCTTPKWDAAAVSYACLKCIPGAPPGDDGACTVGKQSSVKRVGPWLLAGAFSLLFMLGRRRRRP